LFRDLIRERKEEGRDERKKRKRRDERDIWEGMLK